MRPPAIIVVVVLLVGAVFSGCQDLKRQLEAEAAKKSLAKNRSSVPSMVGATSNKPELQCPPGTVPRSSSNVLSNAASSLVRRDPDYCVSIPGDKSGENLTQRYPNGKPKVRYLYQGDVLQVTHWYSNGSLKEQTYFTDNAKNGLWRTWHENGRPAAQGAYRDNKKSGEFQYWSPDGALLERGAYRNDLKSGLWIAYYDGKRPKERTMWARGMRNGNSETLSLEGRVLNHGAYRDDQPVGRWVNYYENGRVKSAGEYADGKKHGRWTTFAENGRTAKVAHFKNGSEVKKRQLAATVTFNNSDKIGAPPPLPIKPAPQRRTRTEPVRSAITKGPGWRPL